MGGMTSKFLKRLVCFHVVHNQRLVCWGYEKTRSLCGPLKIQDGVLTLSQYTNVFAVVVDVPQKDFLVISRRSQVVTVGWKFNTKDLSLVTYKYHEDSVPTSCILGAANNRGFSSSMGSNKDTVFATGFLSNKWGWWIEIWCIEV